jgi:phosphoserine phosphatase RsbU/P
MSADTRLHDDITRGNGMTPVLVADDDPMAREILTRTLRRWEIDTVAAADGAAAWTLLATTPSPALAIVDWMMPGVDGIELCRRIRGDAARAHMYVIVLSSRDLPADVVAGLDAGADDYLVKPFKPEELRARISAGLRVLSLQARLADRLAELETALAKVKELRGLLPICAYCKRIRGDANYWEQLESYISAHTDATFSHGICPPCFATVMADIERNGQ